jgi:asparagine synthase (glutamine-hydrolysing)
MCGIAGFIGAGDQDDIQRMTARLTHRGPDDEGYWRDPPGRVFLGHRRLSILDLAGGHQPMTMADGELAVVFNGEIYNFLELRAELRAAGHAFVSERSDTEVLLHGYREWGTALTGRLNGMWAFALYDRRQRALFCSRDRFGKKPFFYAQQNGTFAFASEASALLRHRALRAELSSGALKKYFAYGYVPAPLSLYSGVAKLAPGCSLVYRPGAGEPQLWRHWEFRIGTPDERPPGDEREWSEELLRLLRAAVRRRLVADVPVGVFLSGGIDSSTVAALAAQELGPDRVRTFSIGFDEESFDESTHAARVARHLRTSHQLEMLSLERARELLPEIVARLDEPLGDSSLLPTYLLSRFARRHVTVALGGDGADELFAGYAPFQALAPASWYLRLLPRPLHRGIELLVSSLPVSHGYMSLEFRLKRTLRGLRYPQKLWNPVWMSALEPGELAELFGEPVDIEEVFSEAIEAWDGSRQADPVDRTLEYYTRLYLQNGILTKIDRASMLNSLEVRSPFLDREVVDFARRIPARSKLCFGRTKHLLRTAVAGLLPDSILKRSKQGFAVPIAKWFRDGAIGFEGLDQARLVNPAFTQRALKQHLDGEVDRSAFLWTQWVLAGAAGGE